MTAQPPMITSDRTQVAVQSLGDKAIWDWRIARRVSQTEAKCPLFHDLVPDMKITPFPWDIITKPRTFRRLGGYGWSHLRSQFAYVVRGGHASNRECTDELLVQLFGLQQAAFFPRQLRNSLHTVRSCHGSCVRRFSSHGLLTGRRSMYAVSEHHRIKDTGQ